MNALGNCLIIQVLCQHCSYRIKKPVIVLSIRTCVMIIISYDSYANRIGKIYNFLFDFVLRGIIKRVIITYKITSHFIIVRVKNIYEFTFVDLYS